MHSPYPGSYQHPGETDLLLGDSDKYLFYPRAYRASAEAVQACADVENSICWEMTHDGSSCWKLVFPDAVWPSGAAQLAAQKARFTDVRRQSGNPGPGAPLGPNGEFVQTVSKNSKKQQWYMSERNYSEQIRRVLEKALPKAVRAAEAMAKEMDTWREMRFDFMLTRRY